MLDHTELLKVIETACAGLDVDGKKLVLSILAKAQNESEYLELAYKEAMMFTSMDEPDWRYVAGRLFLKKYELEIESTRGYGYGQFYRSVVEKINNGIYDGGILDLYTREELEVAGEWLDPALDDIYDIAGAKKLVAQYLHPGELVQEVLLLIALWIASREALEERMAYAKKYYLIIANHYLSLATPILGGLRLKDANLASCFILGISDSTESITETQSKAAFISKEGGGVGIYFGNIRGSGARIKHIDGASSGPVNFMPIFNYTAVGFNQLGRRSGAFTLALDVWHKDVLDFIDIKSHAGDQRRKCHDIHPQLVIPDAFMRAVENKEDWYLVCPLEVKETLGYDLPNLWGEGFDLAWEGVKWAAESRELKNFRKLPAKEIYKLILEAQVATAEPYLFFKDAVNRANPNKHEGIIPSGNLCMESFSLVNADTYSHTCTLISINLANNLTSTEIEKSSRLAVRMLDRIIELTKTPTKCSEDHNERYRVIGIGSMGLADWLAYHELKYEPQEAISNLFEDIAFYSISESVELARELGAYPAYPGSEWDKGLILCHPLDWFKENSNQYSRWETLAGKIAQYGIRNSQLQAIAPNSASSLVQGCTSSILPPFNLFFSNDDSDASVPILPPYINDKRWFYRANQNLPQEVLVDVVSLCIQPWTDTGISMELLFNLQEGAYGEGKLNAGGISRVIKRAWKQGCKTIYYVRTITAATEKIAESECVSCAN